MLIALRLRSPSQGTVSGIAISLLVLRPGLDWNILQQYCCKMIPDLVSIEGSPWDVLPPGVHVATLSEIEVRYAYNSRRRDLLVGLVRASVALVTAGCRCVLLDGSFVTAKPIPNDYDACWDPAGIDFNRLDLVFGDFSNGRANQKARFGGEFFPSTMIETDGSKAFAEFFQVDRFTGKAKGILEISINIDPVVARRMSP